MKIELTVNNQVHTVETNPVSRLLDVLRVELGLTGTKEGCGEGECGSCTVLMDGQPVNSCLLPVAQAMNRDVRTIESLKDNHRLHPVQDALLQFGGGQCGICTPGISLIAASLMESEPDASRERIRTLLAGNLCRCTGYQSIVDAIESALQHGESAS